MHCVKHLCVLNLLDVMLWSHEMHHALMVFLILVAAVSKHFASLSFINSDCLTNYMQQITS